VLKDNPQRKYLKEEKFKSKKARNKKLEGGLPLRKQRKKGQVLRPTPRKC